jgi:hypothetical protein
VEETAEQVAATHRAFLFLAGDAPTSGMVRRLKLERPVGTVPVAGSARGAVLAFRRARFPGPPPEPGVPVIPAPGSPRGP